MKKSELLAKYWCFEEDMIPVEKEKFFKALEEVNNSRTIKRFELMNDTECVSVIQDGYAYYMFTSEWYATRNSMQSDSYWFKLKVSRGDIAPCVSGE